MFATSSGIEQRQNWGNQWLTYQLEEPFGAGTTSRVVGVCAIAGRTYLLLSAWMMSSLLVDLRGPSLSCGRALKQARTNFWSRRGVWEASCADPGSLMGAGLLFVCYKFGDRTRAKFGQSMVSISAWGTLRRGLDFPGCWRVWLPRAIGTCVSGLCGGAGTGSRCSIAG